MIIKKKINSTYHLAVPFINSRIWQELIVPYLQKVINEAIPTNKTDTDIILRAAYRAEMAKDLILYIENCAKLANNEQEEPKKLFLVSLFSRLFTKGVK